MSELRLPNIHDLSRVQLEELVSELGMRSFVAGQIYQWLYEHGVSSFDQMTNLSAKLREELESRYTAELPRPVLEHTGDDATTKYLFALDDDRKVETVMIPADRKDHAPRRTVCVSSQVGCAMGCTFCHTGTMGLIRQLSQSEILGQVLAVRAKLLENGERLSNVVMMGMGEPLHNYDPLISSLRIMTDLKGIGLGKRRITVSTVGLAPAIRKFAREDLGVKLALSLHATTDEQRQELIPLAKKYPLEEVLDACNEFCRLQSAKQTRVTFEYLMLREVNDTKEDAKRLVQLASHVPCKVNLIPLNEYPGCPWKRPEDSRIQNFASWLEEKGLQVNVRHSRGRDILAACGQLATQKKEAV